MFSCFPRAFFEISLKFPRAKNLEESSRGDFLNKDFLSNQCSYRKSGIVTLCALSWWVRPTMRMDLNDFDCSPSARFEIREVTQTLLYILEISLMGIQVQIQQCNVNDSYSSKMNRYLRYKFLTKFFKTHAEIIAIIIQSTLPPYLSAGSGPAKGKTEVCTDFL